MKKVVIIGAGSIVFTQGLVMDIISHLGESNPCGDGDPRGGSVELALCDIDPHALSVIERLVKKIMSAKGTNLTITADTDRKKLLPGAEYVVCTIGVGGRKAWEHDVLIPRKYGIYQPVGDTTMPGGISRAMRMIPALLDILADVKAICPEAFVFNYANPMTVLTRAANKATDIKMTGLCHGVIHTERYIAEALSLNPDKLTATSVGLNHLTFMYDIRYDGEDIKPHMHDFWKKNKNNLKRALIGYEYCEEGQASEEGALEREPFSWEFFDRYDAFPAPGDRHITEFLTESFPEGMYFGNRLGFPGGYSFEACIKHGDKEFANMEFLASRDDPLPEEFFAAFAGEHEQLVDIITSIEGDRRKVYSVNLPNNGAVSNLPEFAVLEVPAVAAANGFNALLISDFPDTLAGFISRFIPAIEVTVEAALQGNRELFAEAILMGGYIRDHAAVSRMVDELLTVHKKFLPQF